MKMIQEKHDCFDDCECKEPKKYYYDDDCYQPKCCKPKKVYYEECCIIKKHQDCSPKPGGTILKCSSGSAGPLPELNIGALLGNSNAYDIGSITIDASQLCNPSILLNFNIIINTPIALIPNLTFTVFKCCNGCSQPVGGSFTFSNALAALSSESFNFQVCDTSNCCDCVTYNLKLTSATLLSAGVSLTANMSALAVENIC